MPKIDSYPRITSPQNNDLLLISDQSEEFDSKSITLSQISGVVNSGKQNQITLTTLGTDGPATFVGDVLNIPNYTPSGGGGSGTITDIATTAPITGGPINSIGTIGITQASLSTDGYLSSADFTTFNNKQSTSEKGAASGYAPLDANQKVPSANLPDSIVGAVSYQGTWNAQNNNPALPNPTTVQGHYYVTEVPGTYLGNVYSVGDWVISNGTIWEKVDNTQNVNSVFGRTGNVVADAGDYSTFYLGINDGYTNADVDAHLNNDGSVADNALLSWDGTDYAWVSQGTQGFVTSVNNQTGTVTLDTDDIAEGSSNLYFPGFGTTATTALAGNTALNTAGDMATTGAVNLSTESLEFDGVNGIIAYAGAAAGGNNKIQIDGGDLVPRNGTLGMVTGYTPTNALDVATKAYVDAQSGGGGGVTFDYTDSSTNLILGESLTFGIGKSGNVGLGDFALKENTVSSINTAVGFSAARYNAGGGGANTAFGASALKGVASTTIGYYNTAVGAQAGMRIESGYNNVFMGYDAGDNVTDGRDNVSIGAFSGGGITFGIENTIVGGLAGSGVQSSKNVVIGSSAATNVLTGSNNIIIGYGAQASTSNVANEITIGDANITGLRLPGLQASASDGDVLTYSATNGKIVFQAPSGGGGGSSDISTFERVFTGSELVNAFNGNLTDQITLISVPANNIIIIESIALTVLASSTGTTNYNANNNLYIKRNSQTGVINNFNCPSIASATLNGNNDDFGVYTPMLTGSSYTRISPQWGGAGSDLVLGPDTTSAVSITAGDRKVKISLAYRFVDVS